MLRLSAAPLRKDAAAVLPRDIIIDDAAVLKTYILYAAPYDCRLPRVYAPRRCCRGRHKLLYIHIIIECAAAATPPRYARHAAAAEAADATSPYDDDIATKTCHAAEPQAAQTMMTIL